MSSLTQNGSVRCGSRNAALRRENEGRVLFLFYFLNPLLYYKQFKGHNSKYKRSAIDFSSKKQCPSNMYRRGGASVQRVERDGE